MMRIFVAGGSGAVGRRLLPLLVERGHEVTAMTRSPDRAGALAALGARPVVADALDREAVLAAVAGAAPQVIVHELTALAGARNMRRFDREFEQTNRLRTEGTVNLLAAARAAGAGRLVAQSYAGWPYARTGGPVKTEEDELDPDPPPQMRRTLAAMRELERLVLGADIAGLALRYGALYGPGTSIWPGGDIVEAVRQRKFPIVGSGAGVWSFIHIDDAASATVAAIERGAPGVYNIVDDEPSPVATWLPALAEAVGARPPRHVPAWLGLLAVGRAGLSLMTRVRGASNAKAKRELGWQPAYPSWREVFRSFQGGVSGARADRGRPGRGRTPDPGARASPG